MIWWLLIILWVSGLRILEYYVVWSLIQHWALIIIVLGHGPRYLPMRYPCVVWNMSIVVVGYRRHVGYVESHRIWAYIFTNNPAIHFYVSVFGVNGKMGIQPVLSSSFTHHTNAPNHKHNHNTNYHNPDQHKTVSWWGLVWWCLYCLL